MEQKTYHDWDELLRARSAAAREDMYARDPEFASALDVSPPLYSEDGPMRQAAGTVSGDGRGLTYRAARKIYRTLKQLELLRPILDKIRSEVSQRF